MRVAEALSSLLECASQALETPVCREFENPGPNAPHDNCQQGDDGTDGQLWVANIDTQPGWPAPTGEPTTCATPWSETIEVGIVRCAISKLTDDGQPPDADDVTADAQQQQTDKLALKRAILCCMPLEGKDMIVVGWEAIEPQGGCVGGIWTIIIRDAGCDCSTWDS